MYDREQFRDQETAKLLCSVDRAERVQLIGAALTGLLASTGNVSAPTLEVAIKGIGSYVCRFAASTIKEMKRLEAMKPEEG